MTPPAAVFPEDIFVAILHKLGEGTTFVYDQKLVKILDSVAKTRNDYFGFFIADPVYGDSPALGLLLHALDNGGAVHRFNADTSQYKPTRLPIGCYGKRKYESLPDEIKIIIDGISEKIKKTYDSLA